MRKILGFGRKKDEEIAVANQNEKMIQHADDLLADANATINNKKVLSVPIAELSTLGAGVASLIPALNTVTQTTTIETKGLYQLANAGVGDVLKATKDGQYWGSLKTAEGKSKMLRLKEANPLSTTTTASAINPAMMMMAVALFSIEKELGNISEMEKQILTFLEVEKEAEIEADIEALTDMLNKYKSNWDNEIFVASNHKLALDIQRTARKNMISYQKSITDMINSQKSIAGQARVKTTFEQLEKKFKYYRLSLYTFSMASFMEIMLSGNFKQDNIESVKHPVETASEEYRNLFTKCSIYLENLGNVTVESKALKGIGTAGETVGKFIGNIPLVKEGPIDEFLQDSGAHMKESGNDLEMRAVKDFASINNPGTRVFIEKMDDMIQIYNHTDKICFDSKQISLVAS